MHEMMHLLSHCLVDNHQLEAGGTLFCETHIQKIKGELVSERPCSFNKGILGHITGAAELQGRRRERETKQQGEGEARTPKTSEMEEEE